MSDSRLYVLGEICRHRTDRVLARRGTVPPVLEFFQPMSAIPMLPARRSHWLSHTSLEARNRCRDLHPSRQQIGECWECYREQDADEGGGGEEERLWVGAVDVRDGVHVSSLASLIAAA